MNHTVHEMLKQAVLYSDNVEYTIIKLSPRAITVGAGIIAEIGEAFAALVVDKDEVTLILPAIAVEDFANRLVDKTTSPDTYRLITFDVVLDFTVIGFMALVSQALAAAGVSILPVAAFSRDHLLVPSRQFDIALETIRKLQSAA